MQEGSDEKAKSLQVLEAAAAAAPSSIQPMMRRVISSIAKPPPPPSDDSDSIMDRRWGVLRAFLVAGNLPPMTPWRASL